MKIQSKFRDYYDFISHLYGADPNAFFDRQAFVQESVVLPPRRGHADRSFEKFSQGYYLAGEDGWQIAHVVVGSIVVTTMERAWWDNKRNCHLHIPEALLDVERHEAALQDEWDGKRRGRRAKPSGKRGQQDFDPSDVEYLIRAVGVPVFRVLGFDGVLGDKRRLKIDGRAPVLKDIDGFTAKYPPEIVWQSIYTTLTSVLRVDPDKAPPVQVGEKYRIEGAGFDLKTSFRHPVNSPAAAAKRRR